MYEKAKSEANAGKTMRVVLTARRQYHSVAVSNGIGKTSLRACWCPPATMIRHLDSPQDPMAPATSRLKCRVSWGWTVCLGCV